MFYIRHHVRKKEDLNILLTCPICMKELFTKEVKRFPLNEKSIDNKDLIIKEKIQVREEYECICPHCKSFSITYINDMKKESKEFKTKGENCERIHEQRKIKGNI
jgi:hypothetical protein